MNRQYYTLLFIVLGASLLLSLPFCPPFERLYDDREIFRYTGLALFRGQVPYRDFFDHKPPFIFFFNFAGVLLGGPWGLWMLDTLVTLFVTGVFFRCCWRHRLVFPWLLPLLFNLMIRDHLVSLGIDATREFTAWFFVLFFCVLMGRSAYRHFLMGLLGGLIFFTQQEQVLALLPFVVYAVEDGGGFIKPASGLAGAGKRRLWRYGRLLPMGAGFLVILLPIVGYFALHRSLGYFWEDAFRFNLFEYTSEKKSLLEHFRAIKKSLDDGNFELPFMIAVTLGIYSLFLRQRNKRLLLAALVAVALTFAPEFMGARFQGTGVPTDFITYCQPLAGSICVLLFVTLAFADEPLLANRKVLLPFATLLCCSLGYTALQHATHPIDRRRDPFIASPEMAYLRAHRPGDYQLYSFMQQNYIYAYNEFRILSPTRWIYQQFWDWFRWWDPDHVLLQEIGNDLLRHHTRYVLMSPGAKTGFINPDDAAWWMAFMTTHYSLVPMPGQKTSVLWQLNETRP